MNTPDTQTISHTPIAEKRPPFWAIQEEIAAMLDVPDKELDEDQQAAMNLYLDELAEQEAEKVDGFAQFIRMQSGHVEACKEEAKRLREKAATMEKRIKSLKEYYLNVMGAHNLKKVQGNAYTLSTRKTESVNAPETQAELEDLFKREPLCVKEVITYKPDKAVIKEHIKAGHAIPGCFIEESQSLIIR